MNSQNRIYAFELSADALAYILAVLNQRPRQECNDLYVAIERARDEQDRKRENGILTSGSALPSLMANPATGNGQAADVDPAGGQS